VTPSTRSRTGLKKTIMGTVKKIDHWGRRRLAYELDKQREGYYVLMDIDIDTDHLPELEYNLKLSSSVLRYLVVRAGLTAAASVTVQPIVYEALDC
jgi:ribosomal protein S6